MGKILLAAFSALGGFLIITALTGIFEHAVGSTAEYDGFWLFLTMFTLPAGAVWGFSLFLFLRFLIKGNKKTAGIWMLIMSILSITPVGISYQADNSISLIEHPVGFLFIGIPAILFLISIWLVITSKSS